MEDEFKTFLKNHLAKVIPLSKAYQIAEFTSLITGETKYYTEAENLKLDLTKIYSNKDDFSLIKKFKDSGLIKEKSLKRQLELLYLEYLGNQADFNKLKTIVELETVILKRFNTYRAKLDNKEVSNNDINRILRSSNDSYELMNAYFAGKVIGELVYQDVIKAVKLRNEVARELGFNDYYEMSLILSEMNPAVIDSLFKELDELTRNSFLNAKAELDKVLAKRYGVKKHELMPWHYHDIFFQEAPSVFNVDFDKHYKDKDIITIVSNYFNNIGMNVNEILANSDLFERKGKYQHACAYDIDSCGDVRIICNIIPNHKWCETLLHELGHAVNFKYYDYSKPWLLRQYNSTLITEGIALFFDANARNPEWLSNNGIINKSELKLISNDCFKALRLDRLIFARWSLVIYYFERSLYANPDQDLNSLWWNLVSKYQGLKAPLNRNKPDWASKDHLATSPCYYHNYIMGELFSSQLSNSIKSNMGKFLINEVFYRGRVYPWNELIKLCTGEYLTPKYFARKYL